MHLVLQILLHIVGTKQNFKSNKLLLVFKGSSGHGRPPSLVEHKQLPFLAGTQTPVQTYQTGHPQSEWENILFKIILLQFSVVSPVS